MKLFSTSKTLATVAAVALMASQSSAMVVDIGLGSSYAGGTPGSPSTPWLVATFADVGMNTVDLTLKAQNLAGPEFVSKWLFNLNPTLDPSDLDFAVLNRSGLFDSPTIKATDQNKQKAGGGLLLDFGFGFETSGSDSASRRFTDDDMITFRITGISGLDVSDFLYKSSKDGFGPFTSIANIQGSGDGAWIGDGASAPVPVPEPVAVIAGCLLLGIVALRERSKFQVAFAKLKA